MKVRAARPTDGPELERLKRAMPYPGSLFYDEPRYYAAAVERLRHCLPRLKGELPDWRLLVLVDGGKPIGYLLFMVDDVHGVTQQLQTLLVDYAVFSFDALAALTARARKTATAFENEYFVADLPAQDQRMQLWFYRCGFRAEQNRVVKRIPRGYRGPSSPDFRVRRARSSDLPFILEVHANWSAVYLPAHRDADLEKVELAYQLTYMALDLDQPTPGNHYFLFEEAATGRPAGYYFIQERPLYENEIGYYVYDVGLAPEFTGRALSLYMSGAAETLAGQEGALVYGDGSLATPALASWHAQMGYTVDTVRFALPCGPC